MATKKTARKVAKKPTKKVRKPTRKFDRKIIIIIGSVFGGLVLLVILAYVFRGWIRFTVVPKTATATYGSDVESTMNAELKKLQQPLTTLGYQHVDKVATACNLDQASGFKTEVVCYSGLQAYQETPPTDAAKKALNDNVKNLNNLLKQYGWSEGNTTLTTLVGSVTSGIDWQPDAAYVKTIGSVQCLFDTNTAFSQPKPAAVASRFGCTRFVDFFGSPWPRGQGPQPLPAN